MGTLSATSHLFVIGIGRGQRVFQLLKLVQRLHSSSLIPQNTIAQHGSFFHGTNYSVATEMHVSSSASFKHFEQNKKTGENAVIFGQVFKRFVIEHVSKISATTGINRVQTCWYQITNISHSWCDQKGHKIQNTVILDNLCFEFCKLIGKSRTPRALRFAREGCDVIPILGP